MNIGQKAEDDASTMLPEPIENRETTLRDTLDAWEKWNGKANDRIRVWFGAPTPGRGLISPLCSISPFHVGGARRG